MSTPESYHAFSIVPQPEDWPRAKTTWLCSLLLAEDLPRLYLSCGLADGVSSGFSIAWCRRTASMMRR